MSEFEASSEVPVEEVVEQLPVVEDHDEYYHFQTGVKTSLDEAHRSVVEDEVRFNKLLSNLGLDFILKGEVHLNNVERFLMMTRKAVEEGIESDEDLVVAMKCNSCMLVKFLISIISAGITIECQDSATRSLVMMGNIIPDLWLLFTNLDVGHVKSIMNAARATTDRLQTLASATPAALEQHPETYLGYDARDKHEFNTEGYEYTDEMTAHNDRLAKAAALRRELLLMCLLFMSQLFGHPLPHLTEDIAKYRYQPQSSRESNNYMDELISLSQILLVQARELSEEAYLYAIKLTAEMNNQFPLPEDTSCEIATVFSKLDNEGNHSVNLTQGLLHVLNENGYPNLVPHETPAVIRLCTDLLYVHNSAKARNQDLEHIVQGHYYTNDIKVILEIVLREMRNIPFNGVVSSSCSEEECALHGQVRYMYMELIDAIIQESSWSTAGHFYLKEELKKMIDEVYVSEEDFGRRDFAYALLYKYKHFFVVMPEN